jgi:hypothetical protein
VRQADSAVTIYLHQFLKLDLSASQGRAATGSEPGADGTHRLLTWSIAIEQAKAGLRLRHYSYHTEKTYLAWIGGFANYTDSIGPADVGTKDVKHFLTHLAVKRRVSASRACRFSHREGLRGRRRSNT